MPERPRITSATDDETGTSATLQLVADDPADVLTCEYRLAGGGWSTFATPRTGSGALQLTGLTGGINEFLATAERDGATSRPSNPVRCAVTDGTKGEDREILAYMCSELSDSISGIAIWYPWATFDPESHNERIQVFPGSLGSTGGRAGERISAFAAEIYAIVKRSTNLGRALELAHLVSLALEGRDLMIGPSKILRLSKPGVEPQIMTREEQVVLVRIAGQYQRVS